MTSCTYTQAIDNIHVPQDMMERAILKARQKTAQTVTSRSRTRYAAAAAGLVLASAAGISMFSLFKNQPVTVRPGPVSTATADQAPTVTPTASAAHSGTAAPSPSLPTDAAAETNADSANETNNPPITVTEPTTADRQPTEAVTRETSAPERPTEPAAQETTAPEPTAKPEDDDPLADINIDRSLLCADGKLYIAFAETGLACIDDPAAFSDDHLYYIETKFGRYYRIQPPDIKHIDLSLHGDQPQSAEMCYLYNSDGEIVGQAPIWW